MEKMDGCQIKDDPIGSALRAIEGKWKVPVMYVLCKNKSMRYSELRKALDITNMMLTSTLKELEADGLVSRVQYNEVPPRVEYSATRSGKRLIPALKEIRMWGESLEDATASIREIRRELPGVPEGAGFPDEESDGTWKFCRKDGTQVRGTVITDPETGEKTELPQWEFIHDAWWCFGADGNLKTGLIYDQSRQGWFYMDRNNGMKTGWALVEGEWRYFDRSGPATQGRMVSDTWVGGWYVNEKGVWDGKNEQENQGKQEVQENRVASSAVVYENPGADLSEAISTARVYRNMTQKELAERTGINQADVSKLEKGTRNPSIAILKRIAEGLDMDLHIQFTPRNKM